MAVSVVAWLRRPGVPLTLALGLTLVAIVSLAPMYFQSLWPAAQVPTAPWNVALVRKPFVAGIMMLTYAPGYMPWLYAIWALAIASWVHLVVRWRRRARDTRDTHAVPLAAE